MKSFKLLTTLQAALTALLISTPDISYAQEIYDFPHTSTGGVNFYVDTAAYPQEQGNNILEIFFRVGYDQITFLNTGQDTLEGGFDITLQLTNKDGKVILSDGYNYPLKTIEENTRPESGMHAFDIYRCSVPPGGYMCKIGLKDTNGSNEGNVEFLTELRDWPGEDQEFGFGDMQFAWEFEPDSLRTRFTKYGLRIIPNATRTYKKANPFLYFYYEAIVNKDVSQDVMISYDVCDRYGKLFRRFSSSVKKWKSGINREWGRLPIITLASNFYSLKVTIHNQVGEEVLSFRKIFLSRTAPEVLIINTCSRSFTTLPCHRYVESPSSRIVTQAASLASTMPEAISSAFFLSSTEL